MLCVSTGLRYAVSLVLWLSLTLRCQKGSVQKNAGRLTFITAQNSKYKMKPLSRKIRGEASGDLKSCKLTASIVNTVCDCFVMIPRCFTYFNTAKPKTTPNSNGISFSLLETLNKTGHC